MSFLADHFRRPRIAAAAAPNRIVIGGAGTGVPLVVPPLVDEELLLDELEELDELLEDELELLPEELVLDVRTPEVPVSYTHLTLPTIYSV